MSAPHSDLLTLLAGLAAVLVAASAIGYVLQWRLSPDGSNAVIENLNDRIRAWWVMVALMGLALIGGRTGVTLLFAFCSFAALREFVTLTNTRRADHWALAAAFFIVLPAHRAEIGRSRMPIAPRRRMKASP
jgi:phosphatidate cytidylyltransferase